MNEMVVGDDHFRSEREIELESMLSDLKEKFSTSSIKIANSHHTTKSMESQKNCTGI